MRAALERAARAEAEVARLTETTYTVAYAAVCKRRAERGQSRGARGGGTELARALHYASEELRGDRDVVQTECPICRPDVKERLWRCICHDVLCQSATPRYKTHW